MSIDVVVRKLSTFIAYVYGGTQQSVDDLNEAIDYPANTQWRATYIDADTVRIGQGFQFNTDFDLDAVNVFELTPAAGNNKIADYPNGAAFDVEWALPPPPPPPVFSGAGVATIAATLFLNQSTTVAVPIAPAQPDTDYVPVAKLFGAAGGLTVTGVSIVDEDTVNVTVQAGLAYVGGTAHVHVTAER